MYREDNARHKAFSRRALIFGGIQVGLLGVVVGRMYQLQVLESHRYRMLADENRISMRLLPPPRGRIVDRYGVPMAVNRENYRLLLVAEQARDVERTLDRLAELIPLADYDRKRVLREISRRRSFVPVTVRENLEWEDVSRIEVNAPDLPGIAIDVGQSREYPVGDRGAHLLGYVAAVSEKEQGDDPLLHLPGFRIGKSGVERAYDLELRGKAGSSQLEVNALGRVIRELDRQEGQPGLDIELSVDLALQNFAVDQLQDHKAASAVLMDVHTGEVLALASVPGFDPNAFNRGLAREEWRAIIENPYAPLTNKAISGQYAPGSTFKMVVALAALEAGVMSPDQRVFCRGHTDLGNARFHCWKRGGHGWLDMRGAIQHSCDVYFYEAAKRVGIDRIAEMSGRFGLGRETEIDLPGERTGLIPTRKWKRGALGVPWQGGETLIAGIGQGFMLTTPLQLAVMTARLANGRLAVKPRLLKRKVGGTVAEPGPEAGFAPLGVSQEGLRVVLEGMDAVTNHRQGTAWNARITEDGWEMAGKTGTSQVRRISRYERETRVLRNEERPWRDRDHALFVGYAPFAAPRYAVSVVVEHGGGGSAVAAPIARDILREALRRDPARTVAGPSPSGTPEARGA
jgi:penicillin-binding protein 2